MMNPKQCLPGFVKCLKFAFEYNFKLICMSYKCLYDLVSAYVPNFNFYDLLLNFALHQSWVCFPIKTWPLYGPLCQHTPSPLHGTAAMQTPRHFQYCLHASKEAHADAPHHGWVITLGHSLSDLDLFLCLSPIAIWESLDWVWLIAVPLYIFSAYT